MKSFIFIFFMSLSWISSSAQNLDSLLQDMEPKDSGTVIQAAFKSSRLVLLNTNKTQKKYDLAFWIAHRFGDIGGSFGGSHTLYGLDAATDIYFGFDYGISDRLTIGIGRSRANELYNLSLKYRLLKQRKNNFPLAITLFGQAGYITRKSFNSTEFLHQGDRMSTNWQIIISRKFSDQLSLMMVPGLLIRPDHLIPNNPQNLTSLGFGGRLKLSKRFSLIADYTWVNGFGRAKNFSSGYYNPLGIGFEIETGGHVFSLDFMNATAITENNFIADTQKSWTNGGVRFGFAVSRNFTLRKTNIKIK